MKFKPNKADVLDTVINLNDLGWVNKNTAILIVHGIGNQLPLETLDHFGRGLIRQYLKEFGEDIQLSHEIVAKPGDSGGTWFDNVLRLSRKDNEHFIDLYEYYWANYTEDKASWGELNRWLQGVIKGAEHFYKKNAQLGQQYKDKSIFFDSVTGELNVGIYRFFLATVSKVLIVIDFFTRALIWLVGFIPLFGRVASAMLESYKDTVLHNLTNIIADVVIYNVIDPKSKFYGIRRLILDGAVKSLKYLIERKKEDDTLYYPSIVIAGHSLGTQVAYDAINKVNLLVNEGLIDGYNNDGKANSRSGYSIAQQLKGFITFGSPLDKIVFFLRENVPDEEYLRQQFLNNFHGFKMRDLDFANNSASNPHYLKAGNPLRRLLEKMKWRNYYDNKDYVSGGLDYYEGLTNIDCRFNAGKFGFTHSNYWDCEAFYKDIICEFLTDLQ